MSLRINLSAQGTVGLAFDSLTFYDSTLVGSSNEALKGWAERFASRATYLMEPLVLVELDTTSREAKLRSETPTARGELRSYYEVRIYGQEGRLNLSRVVFDQTTRCRQPGVCLVTIEVLERLADDLAASSHPQIKAMASIRSGR